MTLQLMSRLCEHWALLLSGACVSDMCYCLRCIAHALHPRTVRKHWAAACLRLLCVWNLHHFLSCAADGEVSPAACLLCFLTFADAIDMQGMQLASAQRLHEKCCTPLTAAAQRAWPRAQVANTSNMPVAAREASHLHGHHAGRVLPRHGLQLFHDGRQHLALGRGVHLARQLMRFASLCCFLDFSCVFATRFRRPLCNVCITGSWCAWRRCCQK